MHLTAHRAASGPVGPIRGEQCGLRECLPEVLADGQRVPHPEAVDLEARHEEGGEREQEFCPGFGVVTVQHPLGRIRGRRSDT